jgi:hypothetical protein
MHRTLKKPAKKEGLVLTHRDETIIWNLFLNRLLTNEQIKFLVGSTSKKVDARVRELYGNDFVDRPEAQSEIFAYASSRPTINTLGQAGVEWCKRNRGAVFPSTVRQRSKNRNLKSGEFFKHEIGVAWILLHAEKAVQAVDGLRIIDKQEMWVTSPHFDAGKEIPDSLSTEIVVRGKEKEQRNTKPDTVFGIADTRGDKPAKMLLFGEYDRGTEPFFRTTAKQSSIYQKMLGYADAYQRQLAVTPFGRKRFRVLWVLESGQDRLDGLLDVYQSRIAKETKIPPEAFLFATVDRLHQEGFLGPIWVSAKGEPWPVVRETAGG